MLSLSQTPKRQLALSDASNFVYAVVQREENAVLLALQTLT